MWASFKKEKFCLFYIISVALLIGCGTKDAAIKGKRTKHAANRVMAVIIRNIAQPANGGDQGQLKDYFSKTIGRGLSEAYGGSPIVIEFAKGSLIQSPENLYKIGINGADDIFLADIRFQGDFNLSEVDQPGGADIGENVETTLTIHNGGNLKTVNVAKVVTPTRGDNTFTSRYVLGVRNSVIQTYSNPNIYPKSDPYFYGNLLYVFSKRKEMESEVILTCENSADILGFYGAAFELFEKAKSSGVKTVSARQQKAQDLESRIQESGEKAQIAETCAQEQRKPFAVHIEFAKIDASFQPFIRQAVAAAELEPLLRKYTTRPVTLKFSSNAGGGIDCFIDLRFNQGQFIAWTANRVPEFYQNFKILSLDPYYALMQKLVVMKAGLPADAPRQLRSRFAEMRMTVGLTTLLNGMAMFGVDGSYFAKKRSIRMSYPNAVILDMPGFGRKTIRTKNDGIFNDKGWIALGNCKTIDGTLTEDGLVYRFFGLPCP